MAEEYERTIRTYEKLTEKEQAKIAESKNLI